jgi:hypothetical protein
MDELTVHLGLKDALQIFLFLSNHEEALEGSVSILHSTLRTYLYDSLSIENMESPETLLAKLDVY